MKTITILSGKGGVGKSSVTASLAVLLAKKHKIVAADCDVDAPNLGLLFGIKKFKNLERVSTNYKAFVNKKIKQCKNVKRLISVCAFHAISLDKGMPVINKFLCEGCGACKLLCSEGIELKKVENAKVGETKTNYGFYIVSGQIKVGESGSGNVVEVVKERARRIAQEIKADLIIVDSSAGIGCPVIASIRNSDFVVAITEPTPSALHDLKRALKVVEHFKISYGIIINKYDLNKKFAKKIENFAKKHKIPTLGRIPYKKDFVDAIIKMKPVVEINPKYKKIFEGIINKINKNYNRNPLFN